MIKKLMFAAACLVASTSSFAQWTQPEYAGDYQPLNAGDTVYIYNTEAKMFLTEGNEWGTHASVGTTGLKFCVNKYADEGNDWDGKTYTIGVYSVKKGGNYLMAFKDLTQTDGRNLYIDGSESDRDRFFSFQDISGSTTYQIYGAEKDSIYSATGNNKDFMLGRYTYYYDSKNEVTTGTGVIYDYNGTDTSYNPGEFQAIWAFVSMADYEAYQEKVVTYNAALQLGQALTSAETLGVPDIAQEKSIYNNTLSTKDDIQWALESLEKKTLAYYEQVVTPDNPVNIVTDPCDAIDAWTNGINASTWNTQTWIAVGWTGFEGTTLNIWADKLSGQAYRQLTDLPNGIYVVSMAIYSQDMEGYAFANDNKMSVAAGAAGNTYQVTTQVTDGTLKFGFGQDTEGTNWVALDNAVVNYYGAGVEAYRYWLNKLLASAPSFDDVTAQTSLVEEYNAVLASVNTATTKDEILAIIPNYEEVLNRVNLNVAAYDALKAQITAADELATNESMNTYYGDKLSDSTTEKGALVENHTLGTTDIQTATAELETLCDEAQNFIWNVEKFNAEKTTAEGIYAEYGSTCSEEAAADYEQFMSKEFDFTNMTCENVENLLNMLYEIEFNLQVPAEKASDDNPVDYTAKINYPSFEGGAVGWTNDGWSTCGSNSWTSFADGTIIDTNYLNLWNTTTASVYQTMTGLPNGTYMVQISAFANGNGFQVYANDCSVDVVVGQNENGAASIYGETTEAYDGAVWYGNIYQIIVNVTNGTLTIGARQSTETEVWAMIDNVKLTYYGTSSSKTPTAIDAIASGKSSVSSIYNISGARTNTLGRGINIVKMANGEVKKVLVK